MKTIFRSEAGRRQPGAPGGMWAPQAAGGFETPWQVAHGRPASDRKMVFIGLSSGDLCRRLKDPNENGGRSLELLVRHVSDDQLVLWGWSPGEGRDPVSIPHAEFVAQFKTWVAAGAPCPAP